MIPLPLVGGRGRKGRGVQFTPTSRSAPNAPKPKPAEAQPSAPSSNAASVSVPQASASSASSAVAAASAVVNVASRKPFQNSAPVAQPERKPISVPVPSMSEVDAKVPKESAVRIEVGRRPTQRIAVPIDTPATAAVAAPAPVAADKANQTLYDLCDSSYLNRQMKGKKRPRKEEKDAEVRRQQDLKAIKREQRQAARDAVATSAGPQVEIVNGQIVIKESSLVVQGDNQEDPELDYEEVHEGSHATARYSSFSNKSKPMKWGVEETRRFYELLQQVGTDFSLMETFFPGRNRRQLKLKFFREEKSHPELIKKALESQRPLVLTPFEIKHGTIITVEQPNGLQTDDQRAAPSPEPQQPQPQSPLPPVTYIDEYGQGDYVDV